MRATPSIRRAYLLPLVVLLATSSIPLCGQATRASAKPAAGPAAKTPSPFDRLRWREVGPYRGGRSAAVCGVASQPNLYYFGATGGGVWKTSDAGVSWQNISDGFFGGSIGAVAVAPSDPNVIYVGGGEVTVRGNVSDGDGVWRSTDAGRTWQHIGLTDSQHIPRIRIHPTNPDIAYVAALGHLYGPNDERGIFRTRDGGRNWQRIHFIDDSVGTVDLILDPTNPRILYASFWRVRRTPYRLDSGGQGSSLWKSTDSGDTWQEISKNHGFAKGPLGIIGVAVSPSNSDNLYAIVEAEDGGVYRSRDAGATWARVNSERNLRQRAWYYSRIYADPADENTVFVLNVQMLRSVDGGKTFAGISTPHSDNHDLWIDPTNPSRWIEANDGGANITFDAGKTWSRQDNQPTAQIYRVSTDSAFPYRILGAQQDNSTVRLRSRSLTSGSIGTRDWESTAGGESGHVVAKPDDPDIVIGGSYDGYLTLTNHRTGESRSIHVWPDNPMGWGAAELRYRFQWNFPIFFSPHQSNRLYCAAQVLFRSDDLGASWTAISGDLTRDDKTRQQSSGGPITQDNTSVEYYGTIFAAVESPHEAGVLWTGSDDGLIHVSRDAGEHWQNVTPSSMPQWAQINSIEAHPFEAGGLYVAATCYKSDDFTPYLYATTDYGRSWRRIDRGIDREHFTRVVRADPERRGLLFAGTERGLYVSFDDGVEWQPFQANLPIVPITDLTIASGDLIAATQGRGFWIFDDLSPLRQWQADSGNFVVTPRPTLRLGGGRSRHPRGVGTNPASGVVLRYYLARALPADQTLRLELFDANGQTIRAYVRKPAAAPAPKETRRPEAAADPEPKVLTAEQGFNEFVWNLRYPDAKHFPGMILWNGFGLTGPRAIPGQYRARFTIGEAQLAADFTIAPDPRSTSTRADLEAQFAFLIDARDKLSTMHEALGRLRTLRKELARVRKAASEVDAITKQIDVIDGKLERIEQALYQTKNRSRQDPLNFPIRLGDKLAGVVGSVATGDFRPTRQQVEVRDQLVAAIDLELEGLDVVWRVDLPALNRAVAEAGVPAITVPRDKRDAATVPTVF